jgi:hypothetical protein
MVLTVPLGMPFLASPKVALIALWAGDIEFFDAMGVGASSSTARAERAVVASKSKVVHIRIFGCELPLIFFVGNQFYVPFGI